MFAGKVGHYQAEKQGEQTLAGQNEHQQPKHNKNDREHVAQNSQDDNEKGIVASQQRTTFVGS